MLEKTFNLYVSGHLSYSFSIETVKLLIHVWKFIFFQIWGILKSRFRISKQICCERISSKRTQETNSNIPNKTKSQNTPIITYIRYIPSRKLRRMKTNNSMKTKLLHTRPYNTIQHIKNCTHEISCIQFYTEQSLWALVICKY